MSITCTGCSTLPNELWIRILKNCTLTELKEAELTCRQMHVLATAIFEEERQRWASVCPEASEWSTLKLIFEVETQQLFHQQSVFLTFARMMGIDRFRNLPVLNRNDVLGASGAAQIPGMTAPVMKGTAKGFVWPIQFLVIQFKLINTGEAFFENRIFIMNIVTSPSDASIKMAFNGIFPFNNRINSHQCEDGHFIRTHLLKKLLLNGVLDVNADLPLKYCLYRGPHQIVLA